MDTRNKMIEAMLIAGHSNSGKSPVGEYFQAQLSTPRRRYHHLDFGECLRMVLDGRCEAGLSSGEVAYVRSVMNGALLDAAHFVIAGKIVNAFLAQRHFRKTADVLLLNGMPRNRQQGEDVYKLDIAISTLLLLRCTPEIARKRKLLSESGEGYEDRSNRDDAGVAVFQRKLDSFDADTQPLIALLKSTGCAFYEIDVGVATSPADVVEQLCRHGFQVA
ncbi:MAG: hypothetical protein GF398_11860 [Chitinivibrionales bacterium]|nr:hypothetical protein [Chitinivibrionales bacterium]